MLDASSLSIKIDFTTSGISLVSISTYSHLVTLNLIVDGMFANHNTTMASMACDSALYSLRQ